MNTINWTGPRIGLLITTFLGVAASGVALAILASHHSLVDSFMNKEIVPISLGAGGGVAFLVFLATIVRAYTNPILTEESVVQTKEIPSQLHSIGVDTGEEWYKDDVSIYYEIPGRDSVIRLMREGFKSETRTDKVAENYRALPSNLALLPFEGVGFTMNAAGASQSGIIFKKIDGQCLSTRYLRALFKPHESGEILAGFAHIAYTLKTLSDMGCPDIHLPSENIAIQESDRRWFLVNPANGIKTGGKSTKLQFIELVQSICKAMRIRCPELTESDSWDALMHKLERQK